LLILSFFDPSFFSLFPVMMTFIHFLPARALVILAILLGGVGMPSSQALANEKCPIPMYVKAESLLTDAHGSWTSLLNHQKIFARCDDGALGEDYSDAVVTLFARRWDQFGVFSTLVKRRPPFGRWAIRHIDTTSSADDLKVIMLNTATCPSDIAMKRLCKTIRQAAKSALTELEREARVQ
jgi:hypothetical protein